MNASKVSDECTIKNQSAGKNDGGTRSHEQDQTVHSVKQFYLIGLCHPPFPITQVKCLKTASSSSSFSTRLPTYPSPTANDSASYV